MVFSRHVWFNYSMIEISHKQARRLIRRAADAPLPEEQWNILQAHLESCAECRAYRDQLTTLEKDLSRGLRSRWGSVDGPGSELVDRVLRQRFSRRDNLRRVSRVMLGTLAMLGVLLLCRAFYARVQSPTPVINTPIALTPSPTPSDSFQGVVAFSAGPPSAHQIFLLNATAANGETSRQDITNLTQNSGASDAGTSQNNYPTWSPDGQWLAFISDRSGSPQLYVINVAGSRLTQLTSDPQINWSGPLSWSHDGKWISLPGRRKNQNNTTWLYVAPVSPLKDGPSGPRAVTGTSETPGWSRFSPSQPLLAVQRDDGGIDVYQTEAGWSGEVTRADRLSVGLHTGIGGAFDWALNGLSLIYLADGPYVHISNPVINNPRIDQPQVGAKTDIIASGILGPYVHSETVDQDRLTIDSTPGLGAFRSLSYQPGGPLIATLQDLRGSDCWTVRLVHAYQYARQKPQDMPGLCVLSDLSQDSWSPDHKWLVLAARAANPATGTPQGDAGVYALRLPHTLNPGQPVMYERLTDLPANGPYSVSVRPSADNLNIQPQAERANPLQPTSASQARLPGRQTPDLVFSEPAVSGHISSAVDRYNSIIRVSPNGANRSTLLSADAANSCPVWSPDHTRIAFLSDRDDPNRADAPREPSGEAIRALNEIFIMDASGANVTQLTFPILPYSYYNATMTLPVYDCPVWSPDGTLLAAVQRTGFTPRLDIIRVDGQLLRSTPVDIPSTASHLVWSPDGQTIYLAEPGGASGAARLASFIWRVTGGSNLPDDLPWLG